MATRMYHREETRSGLRSVLTWDGALQYKKTGVIPPYDGNLSDTDIEIMGHARADSAADSAGLKMTEVFDDSNRPIREFSLAPGATKRDTWMKPYRAEPQLQIRINKNANPPGSAEALAYQARWEETQRQIVTGEYTLPKI